MGRAVVCPNCNKQFQIRPDITCPACRCTFQPVNKRKTPDNQELQDAITDHIPYEIELFSYAYNKIASGQLYNNQYNVYLETCLVHVRNLIKFIFNDAIKAQKDDIIAEDYFASSNIKWKFIIPTSMTSQIKNIKSRINKTLSHISTTRSTKFSNQD